MSAPARLAGPAFALAFTAAVLGVAATRPTPDARPARVVLVVSDPALEPWTRALDRLTARAPELARRIDLTLRAPSTAALRAGAADADVSDAAPEADVVVVELLEASWALAHAPWLDGWSQARGRAAPAPRTLALGPAGRDLTPDHLAALGLARDEALDAYWDAGSGADLEQALRHLLRLAGHAVEVAPPTTPPAQGYVAWDADGEARLLESWEAWRQATGDDGARPRVAILEFPARVKRDTLTIPRAIARALEARGLRPVVVFAQPGSRAVRDLLRDDAGPRVEAVLALHLKFVDGDAAAALTDLGVPCLNAIRVYGRTVDAWRASTQGLTTGEVAWQLAVPELSGLAPHTVVAALAPGGRGRYEAVNERVERLADRAAAWARLRATPPGERRVALLYWNYPPGKHNVGASYLNVIRSIPTILADLRGRGLDVGPAEGDATVGDEVIARGRNVARWAPGELDGLLASGEVVRLPLATYEAWFAALPRAFQRDVVDHWGPPAAAEIMAKDGHLLLPVVRRGNVVLLPQPDRARTQDLAALYQKQDLPPHHQYVAAYLWLQRTFDAHAVVHLGTHGTHEWLSGKESGLSGDDPGEVLAGHLPILYPYIVDDIGEGIVAKRRGAAVVVDHLTPALGTSGLAPELAALRERTIEWRAVPDGQREEVLAELEAEVVRRGLDVDLGDVGWRRGEDGAFAADAQARVAALEDHLEETRARTVPLGLHTFGRSPEGERLDGFVALIEEAHGAAVASTTRANLVACGPSELGSLAKGLAGGFVAPGPGNDPLRDPAAVPTGKDFFAFDPRTVPGPRQEALGADLARRLVERLTAERGQAPRRLALQVWGVETIRHAGVQEAQALALLGVRCVRDRQGRVSGLELVPREALGRPRVDVVLHATSLYRDTFPVLVELFDQAVRLAAASPEPDNPIAAHATALVADLVAGGMSEDRARARALVRVWAEPTGKHDSKVAAMAGASGSWDAEAQVAGTWIRRMSHGYGGGQWGEPMEAEFRAALRGTEAIVHTRASSLYATLDNDDYFSYGGSIALGVRSVDGGRSPPFYVTDLRRPGREEHVTLERFMGQELRSRYLSPDWMRAVMEEGYSGARHVWKGVEHLWGWEVVYPEAVGPAKWQEVHEVWVEDRHGLGLEAFFERESPHARQAIAARLLEVVRKERWDPDDATRRALVEAFVGNVERHDVSCDHLTCDHPELTEFVRAEAERLEAVPADALARAIERIERAAGRTVAEALARRQADKADWHAAPAAEAAAAAGAQVSGLKMTEEVVREAGGAPAAPPPAGAALALLALAALGLLGAALEARG